MQESWTHMVKITTESVLGGKGEVTSIGTEQTTVLGYKLLPAVCCNALTFSWKHLHPLNRQITLSPFGLCCLFQGASTVWYPGLKWCWNWDSNQDHWEDDKQRPEQHQTKCKDHRLHPPHSQFWDWSHWAYTFQLQKPPKPRACWEKVNCL